MAGLTGTPVAIGQEDPFAGLEPLADDTLSESRGGFVVGGYDIEIGLSIETHEGFVAAFVTNPDVLLEALQSVGRDAVYLSNEVLNAGNLVTVLQNDQDNIVLTQTVRLDVVIVNELPMGNLRTGLANFSAAVPFTQPFTSF
jgi:hypothetical protein